MINNSQNFEGEIPEAMVSKYVLGLPNEELELYRGPINLEAEGTSFSVDGSITLVWKPSPDLIVDGDFTGGRPSTLTSLVSRELAATFPHGSSSGLFTSVNPGETARPSGAITGRLGNATFGSGLGASEMRFHLVNFLDCQAPPIRQQGSVRTGRLDLSTAEWRVAIDSVEHLSALIKGLNTEGGYSITHVGSVRRIDGATFTYEQAEGIVEWLFYLLSFARGLWVPQTLFIGLDLAGETVWERWQIFKGHRWANRFTWFSHWHPGSLVQLAAQYDNAWADENTRDALIYAITYYVEAHSTLMPEAAIILAQAGLELLATRFSQRFRVPPPKRGAAARLKALLEYCDIDPLIPQSMRELHHDQRWVSGPEAITHLRNAGVHPGRPNVLFDSSLTIKVDALDLALTYLHLVILHSLSYQGNVRDTTDVTKPESAVRSVPWV